MKYFKQTKETRRLLSFFLSLALMISLVPASSKVAEAAKGDKVYVLVTGTVPNATYSQAVEGDKEGTATITVIAKNGTFKDENAVTVTPKSSSEATGSAVTATGSSVTGADKVENVNTISSDKSTITIALSNITDNVVIELGGTGAEESKDPDTSKDPVTPEVKEYKYTVTEPTSQKVEVTVSGGTATTATTGAIKATETLTITVNVKGTEAFAENKGPVVKNNGTVIPAVDNVNNKKFTYEIVKPTADVNVTIEVNENDIVAPKVTTDDTMGNYTEVEAEIKVDEKVIDEIADLTEVDKKQIEDGNAQLVLKLDASNPTETNANNAKAAVETVTKDNKDVVTAINTALGDGSSVTASDVTVNSVKTLDIVIKAFLKDIESGKETAKGEYSKPQNPVTITIPVSTLKVSATSDNTSLVRVFYVLHLDKDGKILEVIPCDVTNDSVSFVTKSFSTFVMCYSDVAKSKGGSNLANYPVSAPAASAAPSASPAASAAPSASPATSATPTTSGTPAPGTGDNDNNNGGSTGGNTGNGNGGNGTVNNPGGNGGSDGDNTTTTTKKKTISKLKVTAKKNAKQIKVTTIKKAKVVVTANRKVIKNGKKSVKKITIKAAKNKKGNVTVKLSKKLKKGDKITVKVSKSGYKTKSKTVKVK